MTPLGSKKIMSWSDISSLPPRLGIYLGCFNPPHAGHRIAATQFLDMLDEVWVRPKQVLYTPKPFVPIERRVEMLYLAFRDCPQVQILNDDSRHGAPWDMWVAPGLFEDLSRIDQRASTASRATSKVYLILGSDGWDASLERGLGDIPVLVSLEPGRKVEDLRMITRLLRIEAARENSFPFHSTDIRRRIAEGASLTDLVDPSVEAYMRAFGLYQKLVYKQYDGSVRPER